MTGQTPILSNTKVTSLGASVLGSTGTIPTLGGGGGGTNTSGIQSLGASVTTATNNGTVDMSKIMSGPPPPASVTTVPTKKDEPSSIAVMTHEKRIYSNKVTQSTLYYMSLNVYLCRCCLQWTLVYHPPDLVSHHQAFLLLIWKTMSSIPPTHSTSTMSPTT